MVHLVNVSFPDGLFIYLVILRRFLILDVNITVNNGRSSMNSRITLWIPVLCFALCTIFGIANGMNESLAVLEDYQSGRVSSYDRTGGNADCLHISTGTVTLAEIEGPLKQQLAIIV